ncbi:MAG: Peptide chain release factor N(5)-glutamine methyltransferase [uncultured Gemmatimonadaceae bacterium]|uniref:peptide chain release factor N(5)-glutamine methyltransferase n=1 Tax=uncultured Gemmatimonadaceae bacterium TaxID=246130 RepID=A0A6J4LRQ3_9BACT|nr:MAG: Peptide chain release factor N(5)-glutamine methyltransferase [uncultured Gemmatimonadaceae bacterium]
MTRAWPVANADAACPPAVAAAAERAASRLVAGAPLAYAVGRAPFRHLTLAVDERVLIPRPETECLVDLVLESGVAGGGIALDVGTGSGAIALALATEGAFARVIATDVSQDALDVARANVRAHAARVRAPVELRAGSLLAPVAGVQARVLVSNPPYVAFHEADALPAAVRDWEPGLALFSGGDGLAATAAIVRDAAGVLEPGGVLALEVDSRRAPAVVALVRADARYHDVQVRPDLTGRDRFVVARRA